jgi:hypothetical protein
MRDKQSQEAMRKLKSIYFSILFTKLLLYSTKAFLSTKETVNTATISTMRAWFTCLTAYIPMGIIRARQTKTAFTYLFLVCALGGLLGFLSTVILDRAIFGVWAIPVLGNFHFNVIQGK